MPFVEYSEYEAVCPHCGAAFRSAEVLEEHVRDSHATPGPEAPKPAPSSVRCSVCGTRLASVAALQRHNRETHVG
ncbi:MAG TPA: C2H2-type zinc finger protein [Thermoplasmata archaeon]|nr:C2H2-type zinc finger protein [Thermoplasmata archaeon]